MHKVKNKQSLYLYCRQQSYTSISIPIVVYSLIFECDKIWPHYYEGTSICEHLVEDAKYSYIANIWSIVANILFVYDDPLCSFIVCIDGQDW